MYSRYNNRSERPLRLPENYGGTAFSDRPIARESAPPPKVVEIAKPSPPPDRSSINHGMPPPPRPVALPPKESTPREPMPLPVPVPIHEERHEREEHRDRHDCDHGNDGHHEKKDRPTAAFLQPFQGLFGHMGSAFPFTHGLGFDELLIIGLIILLSRSGDDSDIVLWLALLLFCG